MNSVSPRNNFKQINWSAIVMFALGFWLSSSLVLDCLIVPSLLKTGMMSQVGFASVGYAIFESFNHIELLCGSVVLAGCLVFNYQHSLNRQQANWSIALGSILLLIAIIYTYILTPQMSGLGMSMNLFEPVQTMPKAMVVMHGGYWVLEAVKLVAATTLLRWCYRNSCSLA